MPGILEVGFLKPEVVVISNGCHGSIIEHDLLSLVKLFIMLLEVGGLSGIINSLVKLGIGILAVVVSVS